MRTFLPYAVFVAFVLISQGLDGFAFQSLESKANSEFLQQVSNEVKPWSLIRESEMDPVALGALLPDDYLVRQYSRSRDRRQAELVIAYFRSQREGFGPHSPQVCLPAAGWIPEHRSIRRLPDGSGGQFEANYFRIHNSGRKSVVLYWYQSAHRTSVGEIEARIWLALDTLLYKGSDISLVRITTAIEDGDESSAVSSASEFAALIYKDLRRFWQAR